MTTFRTISEDGVLSPDDNLHIVDCQKACPAHTPVPDYIRLVADGRYTEAYLLNRDSNVFPGILGRICDRPCEPACRRSRLDDKQPVAICRLKRVAADFKDSTEDHGPKAPPKLNGVKVGLIGAGPASLTVANDLIPLGFEVHLFEGTPKAGGAIRYNVPLFRLPETVLNEETDIILKGGVNSHFNTRITSVKKLFEDDSFDFIFAGTGAPKGILPILEGDVPKEGVWTGVDFLASVAFKHLKKLEGNVLIIGGGNTAMDCARTAKRLGAQSVELVTAETYSQMRASPWEKEDTLEEHIPFTHNWLPVKWETSTDEGLISLQMNHLEHAFDEHGAFAPKESKPTQQRMWEGHHVIFATGQTLDQSFLDLDLKKTANGYVEVDRTTLQTSDPRLLLGGDVAFGPQNMITAVAHGHDAAVSIVLQSQKRNPKEHRPPPGQSLQSQRMGLHQWMFDNPFNAHDRHVVPTVSVDNRFDNLDKEVELGFDKNEAIEEAKRCLNCDAQTVFQASECIECDACLDICPVDCLSITPSTNDPSLLDLRRKPSENTQSFLTLSSPLPQTQNIMVKDEDICLHCGLCAERCPTGAWDLQKWTFKSPKQQVLKTETL